MTLSLPSQEFARLEAVARYQVVGTPPEEAFSRLALVAAQFFRAPVALVNIVAADHTWSKACVGVDLTRLDRQVSFCARTVEQADVLVSLDLSRDPRFADNPLAAAPGGFRFYAGAPLRTPDGHNVGTLCVLDHVPRAEFTLQEREALANLAALAVDELELRRARQEAEREALARQRLVDDLRRERAHAQTLAAVSALADLDLDPEALLGAAAELVAGAVRLDWAALVAAAPGEVPRVLTGWGELSPAPLAALAHLLPAEGSGAPLFVEARPELAAAGVRGAVLAPLGRRGEARVVLAAGRAAPGPWSHAERELLGVATRTLGGALLRFEREERMRREARHDPLTGLGNRRALEDDLEEVTPPGAVAVLDLDGFKAVNDSGGHARGDTLLRLFAGVLAAELPPGAAAYRSGGDEFVLLLPHAGDPAEAGADVLCVLDAAVAAVRSAGFPGFGASFGVACWPGEAEGTRAALALADGRMYLDKRRPGTSAPHLSPTN